jgi:hypothetical protein
MRNLRQSERERELRERKRESKTVQSNWGICLGLGCLQGDQGYIPTHLQGAQYISGGGFCTLTQGSSLDELFLIPCGHPGAVSLTGTHCVSLPDCKMLTWFPSGWYSHCLDPPAWLLLTQLLSGPPPVTTLKSVLDIHCRVLETLPYVHRAELHLTRQRTD